MLEEYSKNHLISESRSYGTYNFLYSVAVYRTMGHSYVCFQPDRTSGRSNTWSDNYGNRYLINSDNRGCTLWHSPFHTGIFINTSQFILKVV